MGGGGAGRGLESATFSEQTARYSCFEACNFASLNSTPNLKYVSERRRHNVFIYVGYGYQGCCNINTTNLYMNHCTCYTEAGILLGELVKQWQCKLKVLRSILAEDNFVACFRNRSEKFTSVSGKNSLV